MKKIIWFLWFQGIDNAPLVVKECLKSCVNLNKDYKVIVLNKNNLNEYIDTNILNLNGISMVFYSDIIRLHLLKKYGGVWVDPTCYCVKPLSEWLPKYQKNNFFCFYKPGKDRLISSWFLYSEKNSLIINKASSALLKYSKIKSLLKLNFLLGKFQYLYNIIIYKIPIDFFKSKQFLYFFKKFFNLYPYFILHYTFEICYKKDKKFKKWFNKIEKYSADYPHKLQFYGLISNINEEIKNEINNKNIPLFKLTHKINNLDYYINKKNTVINYLITTTKKNYNFK